MKAIVLLFLFALATSEEIVGGWVKRSFRENDMNIDRSRVLAEKKYYELTGNNEANSFVEPISVYSQLVNGYNFRIFVSAKNTNSNEFTIHDEWKNLLLDTEKYFNEYGFYLDKISDELKPCDDSCLYCDQGPIKTDTNCLECKTKENYSWF